VKSAALARRHLHLVASTKEKHMLHNPSRPDAGQPRSPLVSAAVLLGIFVAMYLAVGGVLHALGLEPGHPALPDAAMVIAARSITTSTGAGDWHASKTSPAAEAPTAASPDCRPGAAADIRCTSD